MKSSLRVTISRPAAAALLVVAAVHYLPEHVAALLRVSPAALDYVAASIESALAWSALVLLRWGRDESVIFAWAASESAMRPVCRLALPLDRPPVLEQGQNLCEAAFGNRLALVSYAMAGLVLLFVMRSRQQEHRRVTHV